MAGFSTTTQIECDANFDLHHHSQNRNLYGWNEYTGPKQEVAREAAGFTERSNDIQCTLASNIGHEKEFNSDSATNVEPAMPRRKKSEDQVDLVHSDHDFIVDDGESFENVDSRARSEERGELQWKPPQYSKLEMPACSAVNKNGIPEEESELRRPRCSHPDVNIMGNVGEDSDLLSKDISKNNTSEYSFQFAWPQDGPTTRRDAAGSDPIWE